MNVTIFGPTGPAGLLVLQNALNKGYKVIAYARDASKIQIQHPNLHIIEGELTETGKINFAIRHADAVISLLGPKTKSKHLDIADGTKNIINAMKQNGVKRLVATVSSSYRDDKDKFQFWFDFGVVILRMFADSILKDIVCTGQQITQSELDWTIIRLPKLSDGSAEGNLKIGYTGDGKIRFFSLTREDLADFIVQQINGTTYLRKAPVVSN